MRNARAAMAAVTTLSLVAAIASIGGAAQAATTGVGTSQVSTTVASLQLGTNGALLGVRLMGDDARSTIDSKVVSAAEAYSRFTGVSVSSDVVAAVKALSSPVVESKQPGGQASVTTGSINLSNPAPSVTPTVTIPSTVLSGTIGLAHLSSEAAATQAKSALSATLTNASAAGGLASVAGVTSGLNTAAAAAQSDGSRSVKVDQVVVLDLASFLAGLGLPITDLPLPTALDVLDLLDTVVPGLGDGTAVQAVVDDLQAEVTSLTAQLTALAPATPALATGTIGTVVDAINNLGAGTVIDSTTEAALADPAQTATDQLNDLIDLVQDALADVLAGVLSTLDGAPLLTVESVDVGVTTKAADTVANSSAGVTAKIGAVKVGTANIATVDLVEQLATINTKVTNVNNAVKGVLGGIDPGLADMVTVSVFERPTNKGVSEANGYVTAVDGITALKASVVPPSTLSTIISTIGQQTSIADDILGAGGTVPSLSTSMATLGTTLNNTAAPLAGGAGVTIASINSTSNFAPQIAGLGGPGDDDDRSLAATGSNDAVPMTAVALLLIALGLGFREWVRMPVPSRKE